LRLDNFLCIGKLKAHVADKAEIARLLAAAERALADAGVAGLSTDTRLDAAYRAIMQAALVAMLADGYRPATSEAGHHQILVQALPKTANISADRVPVLDASALSETKVTIVASPCLTALLQSALRKRANCSTKSGRGWRVIGRSCCDKLPSNGAAFAPAHRVAAG
jgi:hypothetical protein